MAALAQLAAEAEVAIMPNRRVAIKSTRVPHQIDLLDLTAFNRFGRFVWLEGDPEKVLPAVERGEGVMVSEVFANRSGKKIGDSVRLEVADLQLHKPILGIVRDYRTHGGVIFGSLKAMGDLHWSGVRFFFKGPVPDPKDALAKLRQRIVDRFGDRFDIMEGRALRAAVLKIFDETFAVTGVLLLIALTVAALGITTTMTVLVLERIRQINTVVAVGGSGGQVRRMILWETLLVVLAGELAGLICGFILSYLLVFVINRQSFGWTFIYSIDWVALALSLPLIVATALGAALPAVGVAFKHPPAMLLRD
jgi:putative ABC transport system permease protein